MEKICRVLIVDDAAVARQMLTKALSFDPELAIVGTATEGRTALTKIQELNPDVVILDIEMPEMDGLEMLKELRKRDRHLPVIMFSTLTERGAGATLDALMLGADDYMPKPSNVSGPTAAIQFIQEELIPKIKHLFKRYNRHQTIISQKQKLEHLTGNRSNSGIYSNPGKAEKIIEVVAIGVSTGGPAALASVLGQLPGNFPVPILIVQHMPPTFTKLLAQRLNDQTALVVREAYSDARPVAGTVWLAPGDYHMTLGRDDDGVMIQLNQDPPQHSCRPSANILFQSVANIYGSRSLAVVMTGMGQDGLVGCKSVHAAGGKILVQNEESSVIWGMAGNVVRANLANKVLPLHDIAGELVHQIILKRKKMISTNYSGGHSS